LQVCLPEIYLECVGQWFRWFPDTQITFGLAQNGEKLTPKVIHKYMAKLLRQVYFAEMLAGKIWNPSAVGNVFSPSHIAILTPKVIEK
jgi:hypothetical protein